MSTVENMRTETRQVHLPFSIPPHVHVCATLSGSVVLDVKRDRFLGFSRDTTELLAEAIEGWPALRWSPSIDRIDDDKLVATAEACESLVREGVLDKSSNVVGRRECRRLDMRSEWISMGDEVEVHGRITLGHLANFLLAFLWVRFSLAWRPFFVVVEAIKASKLGHRRRCDQDPHDIAVLVEVFRRLRPWVFAAEGRCLLHALTLTKFLARYRFHPDWVIGVTTEPWAAHSWVQWGRFLLDSNPEKVCGFTPIMVV
jgi:Transglutaminase-like superfamily